MTTPQEAPVPSEELQKEAPVLSEELQKMEYEPLNAVEQKLIWYTFASGVVLLVLLVYLSRSLMAH